jgi:hypothetical protein
MHWNLPDRNAYYIMHSDSFRAASVVRTTKLKFKKISLVYDFFARGTDITNTLIYSTCYLYAAAKLNTTKMLNSS